ncbi:hypothetical protein GCM10009846_12160 [Agrococcus versicolor]|uniref:Uncharacterized protein n=1 Tax=Agrococcus versicolor TaxID=501482 RepID=A0ABP5MDU2_9MICO
MCSSSRPEWFGAGRSPDGSRFARASRSRSRTGVHACNSGAADRIPDGSDEFPIHRDEHAEALTCPALVGNPFQ